MTVRRIRESSSSGWEGRIIKEFQGEGSSNGPPPAAGPWRKGATGLGNGLSGSEVRDLCACLAPEPAAPK